MYCKNCGRQIDDSSKFCSICGVEITHLQQNNPKLIYHFEHFQNNEKRYNYRSGVFGFTIFQAVLCMIMVIINIICLSALNKWSFLSRNISNTLIIMFVFGILLFLILFFLKIVKAVSVKGTYLLVNETNIQGSAGTPSYLGNVSVNVLYRDITMVTAQSGLLIVNTTSGSYKFLLENNQEAASVILSRMQNKYYM